MLALNSSLNDCLMRCFVDLVLLQDLPGALSDAQVAEALGLADIRNRDWAIFKTSAIKGDGLFEGLDWLSNTLKARG
jgi:ADP-ribosylation factor-like protein 1